MNLLKNIFILFTTLILFVSSNGFFVKQITAMQNEETKNKITENCIKEINSKEGFIDLLNEIDIQEINIHGQINKILKKDPIVSLPIDFIPNDLEDWAKSMRVSVEIRLIEKKESFIFV